MDASRGRLANDVPLVVRENSNEPEESRHINRLALRACQLRAFDQAQPELKAPTIALVRSASKKEDCGLSAPRLAGARERDRRVYFR